MPKYGSRHLLFLPVLNPALLEGQPGSLEPQYTWLVRISLNQLANPVTNIASRWDAGGFGLEFFYRH